MRYFLSFILCLCIATSVRAQDIQEIISEGGIKAWLVQDANVPTISISFYFDAAGAITDPKGKRGAMNLTAALLDQGAGDLDSEAFERRLNDLSVEMDFSVGRDNFYGAMRSLRKYRKEASELLRLSLTEARFDNRDFKHIKTILLSNARQDAKQPGARAGQLLWRYVFGDDAYGMSGQGDEASLKKVSRRDVKAQYRRLAKENLNIGVAGNISASELRTMLDDVFGDLPAAPPPLPQDIKQRLNSKPVFLNQGKTALAKQAVPQSQIAFLHEGIGKDDKDFFAAYLLNHIIGGSVFSSRLGKEVREQRGLAYSINSNLHILDRAPIILGWGATNNEKAAETLQLIKSLWRDAADGNFTQEELDKARRYVLGSYALGVTDTSSLAHRLAYLQREGEGRDYRRYRRDKFNAVSLKDLQDTAKRLFKPQSLTFAIVGDPQNIHPDYSE